MIGWLQGQIIDKQTPGKLVMNVNGVGYDVETSLQTFFQLEAQSSNSAELHIHTVVREDALLLFGFFDKLERTLFRSLIKVNGIGPKVAISILSSVTPTEFIHCIQQQNIHLLTKLPGIGKKTAERLIIEMKDTLAQFSTSEGVDGSFSPKLILASKQEEAISALQALGYKLQDAQKIITKLDDGHKTCEQLIRQALQSLSAH